MQYTTLNIQSLLDKHSRLDNLFFKDLEFEVLLCCYALSNDTVKETKKIKVLGLDEIGNRIYGEITEKGNDGFKTYIEATVREFQYDTGLNIQVEYKDLVKEDKIIYNIFSYCRSCTYSDLSMFDSCPYCMSSNVAHKSLVYDLEEGYVNYGSLQSIE